MTFSSSGDVRLDFSRFENDTLKWPHFREF
jgi:hypothetical protein